MSAEQIRVSVVMPVYNVADFVGRAVESILKQDFRDLELICVDDGSKDGSGEILEKLAKQDRRMRVIHQGNAGAAAARNVAIDLAQGEYLYFCDADDWAEPDMLSKMVARADETKAQLVIAGFFIETYSDPEHFVVQRISRPDAVLERGEFRQRSYDYFDCNLLYPPWNKLYRTDYVTKRHIRFQHMRMDDFPFNLDYIRDVDSVTVMENCFYHFTRARTDSETTRYYPDMFQKREDEHSWLKNLYAYWRIDDDHTKELLARRYVERLVGCFENVTCAQSPLSRDEQKREIARMLESPNVKESMKLAKPRSIMMNLILVPVKLKCVPLIHLESRFISFVRHRNLTLFAKLKASR